MSDEKVGWDDARLEAAYRGLAASSPPAPGLATATVVAVREAAARPSRWSSRPALLGLAGVAVAAVIVVAIAAWPRGTTVPVGTATRVAELPVIDVPTLLEQMDAPSPEEVIVRGWFAVAPVEADCEVVEDPHPLVPDCEEWYRFLMAEPETLGGDRGAAIEPAGAFVIPMLRVDSHIGIVSQGETVEVLAVGHIADHRAGTCPEVERVDCGRRFVIDRLLPAGAEIVDHPEPWLASAPPTSEPDAAVRALVEAIGPVSVVSIGTIAAADLPSIEPIAAGDEPVDDRTLWVVRAFVGDQPVARTFLLVDGALDTSLVSEVTATSVTDVVATNPTAAPSVPPTSVLGLPVIDVSAAIERRDAGEDDAPLAVRGWISPVGLASCPSPLGLETLLQTSCPEPVRLTADPESAVTVTRNSVGTVTFQDTPPTGASVDLVLDQVDTSWIPPLPDAGPAGVTDVVLLGHFDDDRAAFCPAEEAQACRDRFVVDRVVTADGREVADEPDVEPGTTVSAPADVVATVDAATEGDGVLGITPVFGPSIRRMDPAAVPHPDIGTRDVYWSVRVLEDGRAVRYVVVDGSTGVYRVHGMDVEHVAGTPPDDDVPVTEIDDSAAVRPIGDVPGGWEVAFELSNGQTRRITVVDRTGTLADVRLASDTERRLIPLDGTRFEARAIAPTTTVVGWGGSLCELETGLEVTDTGAPMLTLTGRSDASCRMSETTTRLLLEWSVDRDDVGLTDARGTDPFPTAVAGLVVQPVDEAIEIRDTDDRREIAVKGWIRPAAVQDCGESADRPLLDPGCRSGIASGHIVGDDGIQTIRWVSPMPLDLPSVHDAPVVLVGHFDDPRAAHCGDRAGVCRDAFVVDATWYDGRVTSGAWQRPVDADPPLGTRDHVNRTVRSIVAAAQSPILAVGAISGSELAELEPAANGSRLVSEPWVWHVTVLVEGQVRTILISDADLLRRLEPAGDWEWFEVVDGQLAGTGADIN